MKILLDTNFFMIPGKFKIDVFSLLQEFGNEIYTLSLNIHELNTLAKKKGRIGNHARLGLLLFKKNKVEMITAKGGTDPAIIRIAEEQKMAVATQDIHLISRLKKKEIKVITLRQKKYLIQK